MWNRKEVKAKGKAAFKRNFWLCVLVSLAIALPGIISGAVGAREISNKVDIKAISSQIGQSVAEDPDVLALIDRLNNMSDEEFAQFCAQNNINSQEDLEAWLTVQLTSVAQQSKYLEMFSEAIIPVVKTTVETSAVVKIIEVLVFSVIEVGACIFFIRNTKANAQADCLFEGFKSERYGTIVVSKFLADLFVALWSLLFVIPGIIKSYEYRLIPYILADRPEVSRKEAFAISKQMMKGNKWKVFVFDLSFLGWYILNAFTLNILSYLYINPFKNASMAEIYLQLKGEDSAAAAPQGYYDYEVIG